MSSTDRMMVPACTCGKELSLAAPKLPLSQDVTHVRTYSCDRCGHETRITVLGCGCVRRVDTSWGGTGGSYFSDPPSTDGRFCARLWRT